MCNRKKKVDGGYWERHVVVMDRNISLDRFGQFVFTDGSKAYNKCSEIERTSGRPAQVE